VFKATQITRTTLVGDKKPGYQIFATSSLFRVQLSATMRYSSAQLSIVGVGSSCYKKTLPLMGWDFYVVSGYYWNSIWCPDQDLNLWLRSEKAEEPVYWVKVKWVQLKPNSNRP